MWGEIFVEIFETIRRNKLRTAITSFSVAWGIFMLIVLLGAGKGVQNGMSRRFKDAMNNSIWIFAGNTSITHEGMKPGRQIIMRNADFEMMSSIENVGISSSRFTIPGENILSRKGKYSKFEIRSVKPDYDRIENINVQQGRFLNEKDSREFRKVAVISTDVRDYFFANEDALGQYIKANGISFKIVGVFEDKDNWDNNRCIYVPVEVAQRIFSGGDRVSLISLTTKTMELDKSNIVAEEVKQSMAKRHHYNPEDKRALFVNNNLEEFSRTNAVMVGISMFIWIIGIGTIIAGVVGISNIMLISVKERRKEIGIRKAIGARPRTIIAMILMEAIIITAVAGYIGMLAGVGTLHLLGTMLPPSDVFVNPQADINIAIAASVLLVVSGALAGYFPARSAAKIQPVEALHYE